MTTERKEIAAVEVVGVSRRYGDHDVLALHDVSLAIRAGEFLAVMGPSGCGKTTLCNLIAGVDLPTSGRVFLGQVELTALGERALTVVRREKVGFVYQFFNLLPTLTVSENVALPLELGGRLRQREIAARVQALLEEFGLSERGSFYPAQLSGGEMQRVAIARAIIHAPDVVIADEPTGNLDSDSGAVVLARLQRICREKGHTVIMATHSEEAAALADRVVHMLDGTIVAEVSR